MLLLNVNNNSSCYSQEDDDAEEDFVMIIRVQVEKDNIRKKTLSFVPENLSYE